MTFANHGVRVLECSAASRSSPTIRHRRRLRFLLPTNIGGYVGANLGGKRAFEIAISHPAAVSFEDEQACLPIDSIKKLRIPASMGYCAMRWTKATLLTTVTSRAFSEVTGDVIGAYAIVKVNGKLYSSAEELRETGILSGNYIDLQPYLGFDPTTGAIVIDASAPPPTGPKPPPHKWTKDTFAAKATMGEADSRVFDKVKGSQDWRSPLLRNQP